MDQRKEQRSALVTGGGSGIGAACAAHLIELGWHVTVSDIRPEKAEEVSHKLGALCLAVSGDVKSPADRSNMVSKAVAHGGRLDLLVNNAGNLYRSPIDELDEAKLLDIFHVNVVSGMMMTSCVVEALEKTGGSIVWIGSIHTRRIFPGTSPYMATKAAINALTRSHAAELGPRNIRVNCVLPGSIQTEILNRSEGGVPMTAEERARAALKLQAIDQPGEGVDIAKAVAYFACSPFVTGAILDVDGGMGLGMTRM